MSMKINSVIISVNNEINNCEFITKIDSQTEINKFKDLSYNTFLSIKAIQLSMRNNKTFLYSIPTYTTVNLKNIIEKILLDHFYGIEFIYFTDNITPDIMIEMQKIIETYKKKGLPFLFLVESPIFFYSNFSKAISDKIEEYKNVIAKDIVMISVPCKYENNIVNFISGLFFGHILRTKLNQCIAATNIHSILPSVYDIQYDINGGEWNNQYALILQKNNIISLRTYSNFEDLYWTGSTFKSKCEYETIELKRIVNQVIRLITLAINESKYYYLNGMLKPNDDEIINKIIDNLNNYMNNMIENKYIKSYKINYKSNNLIVILNDSSTKTDKLIITYKNIIKKSNLEGIK